jgi:signal transduction histidine kinase
MVLKNSVGLSEEILKSLNEIFLRIKKGNEIQSASSSMLLLNVEDILGFAQIKAGKFSKIEKKFNIKRCVEEIVSILSYQAESKEVTISCQFLGFPSKATVNRNSNASSDSIGGNEMMNLMILSDEKRIKQIIMNLQSNALKFTKPGGHVFIQCSFVKGTHSKTKIDTKKVFDGVKYGEQSRKDMIKFQEQFLYKSETDSSDNSEDREFDKLHKISKIYNPGDYDKIVISVLDTGIGIKKKDQRKLFKLFGTLQNTRQMNT